MGTKSRADAGCKQLLQLVIVVWFTLSGSPLAIAQQRIEWKVVNRFPLLVHPEDLDVLARNTEAYLANPTMRNPAAGVPATRWDYYYQRYDEDLIHSPIVVQLSLAPPPASGACTWTIDDAPLATRDCGGVRHVFRWDQRGAKVTVRLERGGEPIKETIEVRSVLIVSLGDSFASGDGVPDVDAVDHLSSRLVNQAGDPVARPALWWDQRCHRSLYAGPAQAAMMLARQNPQLQVVFVSFACSGAEIMAGLLGPYAGRQTYGQLAKQLRTFLPNAPASASNRPARPELERLLLPFEIPRPKSCEAQSDSRWECRKDVVKAFGQDDCKNQGGCPSICRMSREVLDCRQLNTRELESDIDACDAICVGAATGLHHSHDAYVGPLPSQLNAVLNLLCPPEDLLRTPAAGVGRVLAASLSIRECSGFRRPVDALLISAGANDVAFGNLLRYSLSHRNSFDLAGFRADRKYESHRLDEKYERLAADLQRHVGARQGKLKVLITQYPNPTYGPRYKGSSDGKVDDRCGVRDRVTLLEERTIISHTADWAFFLGMSENEVGDLRGHVIDPLQSAVRSAAAINGWEIVSDYEETAKLHGYCNRWERPDRRPWFHTHGDSLLRQGELVAAFDSPGGFSTGVMHPNILGQYEVARSIARGLSKVLGLSKECPGAPC